MGNNFIFKDNPYSCANTDNGKTDQYGDSCNQYILGMCGHWDDDDFKANDMCCNCGGGFRKGKYVVM